MKKMTILRPLTLSFLLLGPLTADEEPVDVARLQDERERLIDIVIELESSFTETLDHYKSLQNDFSALKIESAKNSTPEEVAKLRAQLEKQAAILRENQIKEAATPADQQETERTLALMRLDLGNLRRELHRERASMEAIGEQSDALKTLEGQLRDLKYQLQNSQGNANNLQKQVTELTAASQKARAELAVTAKALAGEKEARQKAEQQMAQLSQELQKQREQAQATLAEMQKKFDAEKAALNDEQHKLGKVGELEKELKQMAERGEIWSQEEQNLKKTIEELKVAKEDLTKRVENMGALRDKAQTEAKSQADEVGKNHAIALEKAVTTQASLELEIARQKEMIAATSERLSKMEEMQAKMVELEKQTTDFQSKSVALEGKLAVMTTEKEKKDAELKKVRIELGQLHLKSEMESKQLIGLKTRLAEIKPVTYARGESDVKDQQQRVLTDIKECLAMFPDARFEIVGHTCDLGPADINQSLSTDRADSLRAFLIQSGIAAELIKSLGEGEANPLVPNTNEENRCKNRRVEIHILD